MSGTADHPGQKPSLANRRLAFDRTRDRQIVVKLFDVLGPRYATRNGGYLRILKCGFARATMRRWLWLSWWTARTWKL